MERKPEEESGRSSTSNSDFSTIDAVKAICVKNARADLTDDHQMLLFLQSWWSRVYSRPLKDPMLLNYTFEELLYEFYDRIERDKARNEQLEEETDRIELEKEKADLDWAEQEERKELEAEKSKSTQKASPKKDEAKATPTDPTRDPANVKWMEEQIRIARELDPTFGQDVNDTFGE